MRQRWTIEHCQWTAPRPFQMTGGLMKDSTGGPPTTLSPKAMLMPMGHQPPTLADAALCTPCAADVPRM